MREGNRCIALSIRRFVSLTAVATAVALAMAVPAAYASGPANVSLPVVSGSYGAGNTLAVTNGTWSGEEPISYAYQWERCKGGACTQIAEATSSTYMQIGADAGSLLLAAVTATNGEGSTTAVSSGMPAVSWGQNDHGQLGAVYKDPYEELPVDVEGLTSIKAFSAAESFNLALLSNGTVASFGGDSHGQLGDNGYKANWERSEAHETVIGLKEVTAVAAANEHAMALKRNGTVWAWGANEEGELGQGIGGFETKTGVNSREPNEVPGLEGVKQIVAGGDSDYALLGTGEVDAWGGNGNGELGVQWNSECQKPNSTAPGCKPFICQTGGGNKLCDTSPNPVVFNALGTPIKNVVAIAATTESGYALLESGKVLSWGSNKSGALGRPSVATSGSSSKFVLPGEVQRQAGAGYEPLTNVVELKAGAHHVLARLESGEVVGWGELDDGALGELPATYVECAGKTPCQPWAAPVKGLEGVPVEALSAGKKYSLAQSEGHVLAFGRNEYGDLANGSAGEEVSYKPTEVTSLGTGVRGVSAGPTHGLALVPEAPAPHVVIHPETGVVRFSWTPAGSANHLNYKEFERPGLYEIEPEGGGELEEEGALFVKSLPKIKFKPTSQANHTYIGQTLEGTNGSWGGAEPITYTYRWQRCVVGSEGKCTAIEGATTNKYKPAEADVGDVIIFEVTAKNAEAPGGVKAYSEPTSIVKAENTSEAKTESVNIKKEEEKGELPKPASELTIAQPGKEPALAKKPYQFNLQFGAKTRWFVASPL
jgi:alpha-tubulin suppressor-like RCC1 family protein